MSRFQPKVLRFEEDKGVVKPDMQVIHTGHLPRPQFATVQGPLEMQRQPQRARLQNVEYVAPRVHVATLWEPPRIRYTQHYSKVENRFNDLNKLYGQQEQED